MAQPKLRFKREDGTEFPEWEEIKLENAVDFLDEKRKPITSQYRKKGQYPYYGASGIIDYIDDYIFDEELVLLSEDGANIVDRNYRVSFIATGKYWVNNHAHCLRAKEGFLNYFLSEALENIDYTVYNTGSAQPKLNQEVCRNLPLVCPCLEEQQKIADLLSTVDKVIAQFEAEVQNLEQQKKAAMQKIFSQEVRFRREDGTEFPEWRIKKLSAISSRVVRKNKGNVSDIPLTIASLYGLVDQREYFNKTIASQNMEGYYLLKNGEFAYNKSYSKGYDFGAIKRLDKYECGALSTLYICFALKNSVDSDFMVHYFNSQKWNKEVSIRCAEGARNHGLLNISTDDFFDIEILLPETLEEQQKIADFLSAYDDVISCAKQELDKWKELKKGLLQQMFA